MNVGSKNPEVARLYAYFKHVGQPYGNQPFTYHLESAVAQLHLHVLDLPVLKFYDREILICATWLHDVIEDTKTPASELRQQFCNPVVELVEAVTDGPGKNRREKKAHVYRQVREVGPAALAVKLADRLANSLSAGLVKDPTSLLEMYRKEQPHFERELTSPMMGGIQGFETVMAKIRSNLGMNP